MKNILVAMSLLCFSSAAHAQQFELGANAGLVYRIKTENNGITQPSATFPFTAIKGMVNHKRWQVGLGVGYSRESHQGMLPSLGGRAWPTSTHEDQVPLQLFANHVYNSRKTQLYYGLSAGIVVASSTTINTATGDVMSPRHNGYNFLSVGPQVGGTRYVSKHLGINAEIKANANIFTDAPIAYSNAALTFGAGIRYRL